MRALSDSLREGERWREVERVAGVEVAETVMSTGAEKVGEGVGSPRRVEEMADELFGALSPLVVGHSAREGKLHPPTPRDHQQGQLSTQQAELNWGFFEPLRRSGWFISVSVWTKLDRYVLQGALLGYVDWAASLIPLATLVDARHALPSTAPHDT
jgi:hypothetical protein